MKKMSSGGWEFAICKHLKLNKKKTGGETLLLFELYSGIPFQIKNKIKQIKMNLLKKSRFLANKVAHLNPKTKDFKFFI